MTYALTRAAAPEFGERLGRAFFRRLLRLRLLLVDRHRYRRLVLETVAGMPIVVLPDVFNPKLLRSGELLVQQLGREDLLPTGSRVLDVGTGSGASAVAAARRGCAVVAIDINPEAVRCTRINALLNHVEASIDARQGDLFASLDGERFDVVLFNPPYYRGVPRDLLDHAWRSPDVIERFAAELDQHLAPRGHALIVLSSDGEQHGAIATLEARGFDSQVVAQRDFLNEQMTVYRLRRC